MICYYQNKKAILIRFLLEADNKTLIYSTYLKAFSPTKNIIRINSNIKLLFKKTLRDVLLLIHVLAGLDMNLEEWKHFVVQHGKMIKIIYKQTDSLK